MLRRKLCLPLPLFLLAGVLIAQDSSQNSSQPVLLRPGQNSSTQNQPDQDNDPDRPILKRPAQSGTAQSAQDTSTSTPPDPDKPVLKRADQSAPTSTAPPTDVSVSDRPTLKRDTQDAPAAENVQSPSSSQASGDSVVFRSDVSLARIDAQVLDSHNRTITGLRANDFALRENSKPQQVRNFSSENMPIDILLLLDVSASMRPHVQRMADAAQDALRVLADNDRVAIMVFDTYTRVSMPFRSNRSDINRGLSDVLYRERFNGGTQITRAMISAADYVQHQARPEARRAIVILTDDGSQDPRDDSGVERALSRADAVLSFLQAPDLGPQGRGGIGGGYPGGGVGGGWPGSGPVILGGGGRRGNRYPGGMQSGNHSAGTADIARDSGGDVFPVDDASALEETLMRLRQRYALHFNAIDARSTVQLDLTDAARRHYPDAEIHYRRVTLSGNTREAGPISITRAHPPDNLDRPSMADDRRAPANGIDDLSTSKRRRVAVDQTYGTNVNVANDNSDTNGPPH